MACRSHLAKARHLPQIVSIRSLCSPRVSFHSACCHGYPAGETSTKDKKSLSKSKSKPELLTDERLQQIVQTLETPAAPESAEDVIPRLLKAIEGLRPPFKRVVSLQHYDKIQQELHNSFTVPQLTEYLKHNEIRRGRKKSRLIAQVMDFWGLKTHEQVKEEERQKKQTRTSHSFTASREELFFIIGDNGVTLRGIEQGSGVNITINVANHQCIIDGPPAAVKNAKAAMESYLNISRELVDVPPLKDNVTYSEIATASNRLLADISTASSAYVALQEDKFMIAGLSQTSVDMAKRLLSQSLTELGVTAKQPLSGADHILVQKLPEVLQSSPRVFLPLHDAPTMPLAFRTLGWSRLSLMEEKSLQYINPSWFPEYHVIESHGEVSDDAKEMDSSQIKDAIRQSLLGNGEHSDNVTLQAIFGHVLFQNPPLKDSGVNLLRPALRTSFNLERLRALLMRKAANRQIFLSSNPPHRFASSLSPLLDGNNFHRRVIRLEYVNNALLAELGSTSSVRTPNPNALRRLEMEFVEKDGQLCIEKVVGEHARSVIDLIGVEGLVDVRLLAKRSVLYTNESIPAPEGAVQKALPSAIQGLIDDCIITGYTDLTCPNHWQGPDESPMTLFDVSFRNEASYLYKNSLVAISQIEEQDSRTRRTELVATPIEEKEVPDTEQQQRRHYTPLQQGLDEWSPFMTTLASLAQRWRYRI